MNIKELLEDTSSLDFMMDRHMKTNPQAILNSTADEILDAIAKAGATPHDFEIKHWALVIDVSNDRGHFTPSADLVHGLEPMFKDVHRQKIAAGFRSYVFTFSDRVTSEMRTELKLHLNHKFA